MQHNCNREGFNAVGTSLHIGKQESALLITSKMTAVLVTQESGLVQEGDLLTPALVETLPLPILTMETKTPWVTFWCKIKTELT